MFVYSVPVPTYILETADGRLIVPFGHVAIDEQISEDDASFILAVVLVEEDGRLRIDEKLFLCLGECDEFWEFSEESVSRSTWYMPIRPEECGEVPESDDSTVELIARARYDVACSEKPSARARIQTPDFTASTMLDAKPVFDEINAWWLDSGRPEAAGLVLPENGALSSMDVPEDPFIVFDPANVVELEDGRTAILATQVFEDPELAATVLAEDEYLLSYVSVWIDTDNGWMLDETATVCLGNCDGYWNMIENLEATPMASPAASPQVERIAPVSTGEVVDMPASPGVDAPSSPGSEGGDVQPLSPSPTPTS